MKSVEILGVRVDDVTMEEAVALAGNFLQREGSSLIVTPNPEMCLAAQRDADFKAVLNQAALAVPDGFGLLLAAHFLGLTLRARVTGADLMSRIAELAAGRGLHVYLLGGGLGVAERAAQALKTRFPSLIIAGADVGERVIGESRIANRESFDVEVLVRIREAAPAILFVAFGQVKQEKWLAAHLPELPSVKVAMGVGGAFDFLAGVHPRAPQFLRALGLEWFWRLMMEPRRIRRIWNAVIVFPIAVIKKALS